MRKRNWNSFDWTKRNVELAAEAGVSRQRIGQVRKALNKLSSPYHGMQTMGAMFDRWARENIKLIMESPVSKIFAEPRPWSKDFYCDRLRELGIKPVKEKTIKERITKRELRSLVTVCGSDIDPCWEWQAQRMNPAQPYAHFKSGYVHRMVFELYNGPIPPGKLVLHNCDNPRCVNPKHLYAGTQLDNARDRDVRGRCGAAVMSPQDALEARRLHAEGVPASLIAAKFNVGPKTITGIVKYRGFSWLITKNDLYSRYMVG